MRLKVVDYQNTQNLSEIQDWWNNFWEANGEWGENGTLLTTALQSWGGTIIWRSQPMNSDVEYIEFENDADATAFILRWS
jgi:hypothetical protein